MEAAISLMTTTISSLLLLHWPDCWRLQLWSFTCFKQVRDQRAVFWFMSLKISCACLLGAAHQRRVQRCWFTTRWMFVFPTTLCRGLRIPQLMKCWEWKHVHVVIWRVVHKICGYVLFSSWCNMDVCQFNFFHSFITRSYQTASFFHRTKILSLNQLLHFFKSAAWLSCVDKINIGHCWLSSYLLM